MADGAREVVEELLLGLRASHSRSLASRRGQCNGRRPLDVFAAYGLRPRAFAHARCEAHRSRPELTLDDRKCGFWGHRIWQRTAHKAGGRGFKPLAVGSRPEQLLRTSQAS